MDILFGIIVIFGIALVLVLVFGGWIIVSVVRLIARALHGGRSSALPPPPRNFVRCGHPRCRAENPSGARFCRRCGKMLRVADTVVVRKVAMW